MYAMSTSTCISLLFLLVLQIVKEKERFRKAPPNYAMKKTQLLKEKVRYEMIPASLVQSLILKNWSSSGFRQ